MTVSKVAHPHPILFPILKNEGADEDSIDIPLLKQYLNTISRLDLAQQKLSLHAIELLYLLLKDNKTIQYLDCSVNAITMQGAYYFAELLLVNTTLIEVNLERNPIGVQGAQYLGNALSRNKSLQTLNLKKTQISSNGANYIAQGVQSNPDSALKILDLGLNGINRTIIPIWQSFLKTNTRLVSLNLADNQLGGDGAQALIVSLKEHPMMSHLVLDGNQLTENNVLALIDLVHQFINHGQQSKLVISIKNNKKISEPTVSLLENALEQYTQDRARILYELTTHLLPTLSHITSSYLFGDDVLSERPAYQLSDNDECAPSNNMLEKDDSPKKRLNG